MEVIQLSFKTADPQSRSSQIDSEKPPPVARSWRRPLIKGPAQQGARRVRPGAFLFAVIDQQLEKIMKWTALVTNCDDFLGHGNRIA